MVGMKLRYYGVRGSIASPGPATARYGGNTSCVHVQAGGQHLILDAGTGLRRLGLRLLGQGFAEGDGEASLFITHLHWDHLQGIPFFVPLYIKGNRFSFYSSQSFNPSLQSVLKRQQSPPTFPPDADFRKLASTLRFHRMKNRRVAHVGPVRVTHCRGHHPGGSYFYRIEHEGKSLVYATDYEHSPKTNKVLARFAKDTDLLIYDAQYTPQEYPRYKNWGHSTYEQGIAVAKESGAKTLHLFHHDPTHDDEFLDDIVKKTRRGFRRVEGARENMEVTL